MIAHAYQKRYLLINRYPGDPALDKVEAAAAFNYYQVLMDGTYGVHNPLYTRKLLRDSISALKARKKN